MKAFFAVATGWGWVGGGGNYRFGVVPGVLAFFEPKSDQLDGVVEVTAEDLIPRGVV